MLLLWGSPWNASGIFSRYVAIHHIPRPFIILRFRKFYLFNFNDLWLLLLLLLLLYLMLFNRIIRFDLGWPWYVLLKVTQVLRYISCKWADSGYMLNRELCTKVSLIFYLLWLTLKDHGRVTTIWNIYTSQRSRGTAYIFLNTKRKWYVRSPAVPSQGQVQCHSCFKPVFISDSSKVRKYVSIDTNRNPYMRSRTTHDRFRCLPSICQVHGHSYFKRLHLRKEQG